VGLQVGRAIATLASCVSTGSSTGQGTLILVVILLHEVISGSGAGAGPSAAFGPNCGGAGRAEGRGRNGCSGPRTTRCPGLRRAEATRADVAPRAEHTVHLDFLVVRAEDAQQLLGPKSTCLFWRFSVVSSSESKIPSSSDMLAPHFKAFSPACGVVDEISCAVEERRTRGRPGFRARQGKV
jgi:hypothetical protein